jgi:prevent-host-death family protein
MGEALRADHQAFLFIAPVGPTFWTNFGENGNMRRMTIQMNVAEAKAKLSELLARAEAGEEVVIARHGRAIATLVAKTPPAPEGKRPLGVWKHLGLDIPLSTFDPDPEIEEWVNKSIFPSE